MTRETAINLLDNLIGMVEDNQQNDYDEAFKLAIRSLKSWDKDVVPVVHGEWLKKGQTLYMCSKCGRVIDAYSDLSKTVEKFPYCHCGARMDGKK